MALPLEPRFGVEVFPVTLLGLEVPLYQVVLVFLLEVLKLLALLSPLLGGIVRHHFEGFRNFEF